MLAHKTYLTPLTPDDISQMKLSIVGHLPLSGPLPTLLVHQEMTMYFNKLYTYITTNVSSANDVDDILQIKRKYKHDNILGIYFMVLVINVRDTLGHCGFFLKK